MKLHLDTVFREKRQEDKKSTLEKITTLFEETKVWQSLNDEKKYYEKYLYLINFPVTAKDIAEFSRNLPLASKNIFPDNSADFNLDQRLGLYLSALCTKSVDNANILYLNRPIPFIGMFNEKKIEVFGDVGLWGGYMQQGILHIIGNADDLLGLCMQGGEIEVYGDAGLFVGHGMFNGKIQLYGGYKSLGPFFRNGDIYQLDNCLVKNGKLLVPVPEKREEE